ncbi:MAG: pectate lyase [Cyclobacteriaceae bacterium]
MKNSQKLFLGLLLLSCISSGGAQSLAFPGAEGFGKYTTGGRGGEVIVVTNLNDSGDGSLREALRKKYPRIVVFSVSGIIELESNLDINHGDLTVAGQSAPGDGIVLKNYSLKVKGDNVIIRYIRSRMGDERAVEDDAISVTNNRNVIIDHCSFSWGTDECATFYDNENLTVQYCIVSESLNKSVHKKGEHGYGGIWGGKKASFHHNLFAHHKSRNPRFHGARYHHQPELEVVDFRNNIIYNWQSNNSYGGEEGNHNIVGNYYKAGPGTRSKEDKILDPYAPYGSFYLSDNILHGNQEVSQDNWTGVNIAHERTDSIKLEAPIDVVYVPTEKADEAFETVLQHAGASFCRDAIDKRVIMETRKGVTIYGNGIIDTQSQVGGYPKYKSKKALTDSDKDGMPDIWEQKKGLNPEIKDDSSFTLSDDYTNIEIYLNGLVQG